MARALTPSTKRTEKRARRGIRLDRPAAPRKKQAGQRESAPDGKEGSSMKKHLDYRKRAGRANAPNLFLTALSAVLLVAEFVFMQELCEVALDTDNAVIVAVVALGSTATTPILMSLAASCLSCYAASGERDKAWLGIAAIAADVAFIAIATWFRLDSETAQSAIASQSGQSSLFDQLTSSIESLSSPEATTALMTGILACAGIASFIAAYASKDADLTKLEAEARKALPWAEGRAFAAASDAYWSGKHDRRLGDRVAKVASLANATVALAAAESLLDLVKDPADMSLISDDLDGLLEITERHYTDADDGARKEGEQHAA